MDHIQEIKVYNFYRNLFCLMITIIEFFKQYYINFP